MLRFSLNQVTLKTTPLRRTLDLLAEHRVDAVGLWHRDVAALGVSTVARQLQTQGLRVSSYTTGGFTTAPDARSTANLDTVRRCLDEAAELRAQAVVIRAGGLVEGSRDIVSARHGLAEAISELEPYAASCGVPLALEPLHPMFAADRGVVVTLDNALDIVEGCDSASVGVALDVYNSWWDPALPAAIARAEERIKVVQVADWVVPLAENPVHSRALPGDGAIDFRPALAALKPSGYSDDIEMEIFNEYLWAADADHVIRRAQESFRAIISPCL